MRYPVFLSILFIGAFLTCVLSEPKHENLKEQFEKELQKELFGNDDNDDEDLVDLKEDEDVEDGDDKEEISDENLIEQLLENSNDDNTDEESSNEVEYDNALDSDEVQDILKIERKLQDPWRSRRWRIRVPRVRVRLPRVRLPRVRLPRIRLPRIRLRRIRIRLPRLRVRFRRLCTKAKICKPKGPNCPSETHITNSMNAMRCPASWKNFFKPEYKYLVDEFKGVCTMHQVCGSCAGVAPWSRTTCNNNLSNQLNNFCASMAMDADNAEDKAHSLKWCRERINKMIGDARSRQYARLSYCQCLPDDFNADD